MTLKLTHILIVHSQAIRQVLMEMMKKANKKGTSVVQSASFDDKWSG